MRVVIFSFLVIACLGVIIIGLIGIAEIGSGAVLAVEESSVSSKAVAYETLETAYRNAKRLIRSNMGRWDGMKDGYMAIAAATLAVKLVEMQERD